MEVDCSFTKQATVSVFDISYDANSDLESFTDQVQNVTQYAYTDATGHYLEDILDPRGIRVSRNEYDADGRLVAIVDAAGNRIEYSHDITGRTETVQDRRGNLSVYVYDDEGNVLAETNALGETITRSYDADRNVLTETNALGESMTWSYDERGNALTETNDLGETTTSTYDSRNRLLSVVDDPGNPVMTNSYDPNNSNLLTTTDALGNTTTFTHAVAGLRKGCKIPDFLVSRRGGALVEVKLSTGALKKSQFVEFVRIARRQGRPMSMMFHRKPSAADVDRMTRWTHEALGSSGQIRLNILHVL